MLNQLNINQYMYNVYDEYIERYYKNAVEYSNNNGLIVRYFKIMVDESYNFDSETSIQTDYKNFNYNIYDFVPIIDAQPPVSQVYFDQTIQGTSYSVNMTITIAGIKNPLPGDLLHYYDITGNNEIDKKEIFRVRNVNYIRSINNKFHIYQLDIEYAPVTRDVLDQIEATKTLQHYYWDNETNQFITAEKYKYFIFITENRDKYLNDIYQLYDEVKAGYNYCKINSIFKIIQRKNEYPIKVMSPDISFADYSLLDFLGYFSLYYKLKNKNPIMNQNEPNQEEPFPEVDSILNDKINKLNDKLNEDKTLSFNDKECEDKEDKEDKDIEVFSISLDDSDKANTYNFKQDNLFSFYDKLYKILFSYYMLNPSNFWKDSIIAHTLSNIKITDEGIFYDINGIYIKYEEYLKQIKYDPGYALSYQGGAQYFSPDNTLGF